ncbi:endothelin-converting enzyme, putative [Ixodes scapularis]|uniref:Endothelin-converting enzyme, putative n=1 Tax=Ixodes scapularis TaxID=6945 RepID=B7PXG8_IXOSC|nr:endothelin-converting enzyme, putative [Ixodes scapularis]|eukprot:XP_002400679.1 endothelin-converting enzyme, putative [Ixodes scapularis]
MVLIFRLHQSRSVSHSDACDTEDCLDYAYRINQMLNRNLNPCKNFSAFVCSSWAENNQNIAAGSVTDGVIQKWLKEIISALQSDDFNASVMEAGKKAKAEFVSCMNRTHEDQREVLSSLRNFMTQRGLSWPDKSPANISALHVLIDLDVNWLVPFWFRVHILPTYDSRPRAIQISPSALTHIWHLQHRSVADYSVTAYTIYWSFVFSLLAPEKDASLYAFQAKHDFQLQEQVVSELQREPITWEPYVTSIKALPRYQDWLTGLKKVFETAVPLHADVTVYITDKRHFDRMSGILERFSNDQLIAHISWWFAQFGGIIAISEALVGFYGSRAEAAQKRVDLCARGVESVYYPLLTSTFARKYIGRETTRSVNNLLGKIEEASIARVSSSKWIEEDVRRNIISKIKNVVTEVWLEKGLSSESVTEMYKEFPNKANSFLDFWIKTRIAMRRYLSRTRYRLSSFSKLDSHRLFEYNYYLNSILMHLTILTPPLYYLKGTKSMLYGGLGFWYSDLLVRSFDPHGVCIDAHDLLANASQSSHTERTYVEKAFCGSLRKSKACPPPDIKNSVFPHLPALDITYAAYEKAVAVQKDFRLKLLEQYSPEQVFFITVCHNTCQTDIQERCNQFMKNFQPFADAFNCPLGSEMNPAKKCDFF